MAHPTFSDSLFHDRVVLVTGAAGGVGAPLRSCSSSWERGWPPSAISPDPDVSLHRRSIARRAR